MKKKIIILFISTLFSFESGLELAEKIEERPKPHDIKSRNQMTINKPSSTKILELITKSKDNNKLQMFWFLKPIDDKGIAFLKKEIEGKDDFMSMWLPGFKRFRRIAPGDKTDAFMGSNLSFEDLTNRALDDYYYPEIPYKTDCMYNDENKRCYILISTPKEIKNSEYSKHKTFVLEVESNIFIAIKEHSYDLSGKLLKVKNINYDIISSNNIRYYIMNELIVTNMQEDTSTRLNINKITLNNGFSEGSFHERTLKRLP